MRVTDLIDKFIDIKKKKESTKEELVLCNGDPELRERLTDRFNKLDRECSQSRTELSNMVNGNPMAEAVLNHFLRKL